jgi:hypothetical protein
MLLQKPFFSFKGKSCKLLSLTSKALVTLGIAVSISEPSALKYMERLSVGACTSTCSEATASSITALTSRLPLLPHPYRTVENLLPRLETEQEEEEEEEEEVKREEQEAEAVLA